MKRAIASAGLLALGAAGAAAQLINADKPWSIAGSLRGFYDDNINTQPEGPGKVDSYGFEIVPSAAVNLGSGATTFKGSFIYDNRYYFERRNTDQSFDLELNLNHNFSERYSVGFTESFVIAQEPQILAGSGAVVTPLRVNGNNLHNNINLNFQAQLTRLFGLVLGYNNSLYSYENNAGNTSTPTQPSESALLDFVQHDFSIDSTWALAETTRGIFGYKFEAVYNTSAESVQNSPNPPPFTDGYPYGGPNYVPADSRNKYSDYVYVGADETFSTDLNGSVRAGLQYADYYQDGNQTPSGNFVRSPQSNVNPYASMTLNYTYGDGGVLAFGFNYALNQTAQAASSFNQSAGATLDEESAVVFLTATQKLTMLTPRLTASGSLQFQNSVFDNGPFNGQSQDFYLLSLDLAYAFDTHLSAETGYSFSALTSDIPGSSYTRNQLFVGVKAIY
jgi:Putative beta-barrel porin 2